MKSVGSSVVGLVALLLATGCSARPSTGAVEGDPCAPVASGVSATPSSEAAGHVELGDVTCSDADSGMSSVDVTVKNTGSGEANYYVTVEFIDSEQRSLVTEHTYFGQVSAAATMSRTVYVVRPAESRGLGVRLVEVKRETVAPKAQGTASSTVLDKAVELFADQGLIPAGTPYGNCPATAPQAYWIGSRGNCWTAARSLPPLPATSTTLAAPAPVPVFPGTVCGDGRVSGSSGRGTCSHHGGISR